MMVTYYECLALSFLSRINKKEKCIPLRAEAVVLVLTIYFDFCGIFK